MVTVTNGYYTPDDVQALADYVQFRLFATVVGATNEGSAYDIRLQEFLGKIATLQFIPAAVDYWGDQLLEIITTGTNESSRYGDRRPDLWKVFTNLQDEVKAEWNQMAALYGFQVIGASKLTPKVSYYDGTGNQDPTLKTIDPELWPRNYRPQYDLFTLIPWGPLVGLPDPTDTAS